MAEESIFPIIPKNAWWALRKKWLQSLPSMVTPKLLAISLGIQERSAKLNVYFSLIRLRLIDKDGHPTEFASLWREDLSYPEYCKQIRQEIYPEELKELAPGPGINRNDVERWFRLHANVGESAAGKMACVYELLTVADPSKGPDGVKPSNPKHQTRRSKTPNQRTAPTLGEVSATTEPPKLPLETETRSNPLSLPTTIPSIHIDIQIHLSGNSSTEQIDQVFESMAKHLFIPRNTMGE